MLNLFNPLAIFAPSGLSLMRILTGISRSITIAREVMPIYRQMRPVLEKFPAVINKLYGMQNKIYNFRDQNIQKFDDFRRRDYNNEIKKIISEKVNSQNSPIFFQ